MKHATSKSGVKLPTEMLLYRTIAGNSGCFSLSASLTYIPLSSCIDSLHCMLEKSPRPLPSPPPLAPHCLYPSPLSPLTPTFTPQVALHPIWDIRKGHRTKTLFDTYPSRRSPAGCSTLICGVTFGWLARVGRRTVIRDDSSLKLVCTLLLSCCSRVLAIWREVSGLWAFCGSLTAFCTKNK